MARGYITPFPLDSPSSSDRPPPRPHTTGSAVTSPTASSSCGRPSSFSLPAPVLRLLDIAGNDKDRDRERSEMPSPSRTQSMSSSGPRAPQPPPGPPPILTLKLSGPSFLDTVIKDNSSKEPLYIIETVADMTSIYRLDSRLREAGKAATIQWPPNVVSGKGKGRSGKSIQMGSGSWRDADDFLKLGALGNLASRKFNLPHYPHTLKWKLVPGNSYYCTTTGIKGPIAVLDAAVLSAPPRLRIFETLIDAELARSQQNHAGVPFLLLDYLVATALLLTTTTQEWLDRPATVRIPGSSNRAVQRWLAIIHSTPLPPEPDPGDHAQAGGSRSVSRRESGNVRQEASNATADDPPTPETPFSGTSTVSPWDAQTTWSGSGSGSGSSEHAPPPSTPGTTPSPAGRSPGAPPVPALPQPQRRLQVMNPEPTPSYDESVYSPPSSSTAASYSAAVSYAAQFSDLYATPSTSSYTAATADLARARSPHATLSRASTSTSGLSHPFASTSASASAYASPTSSGLYAAPSSPALSPWRELPKPPLQRVLSNPDQPTGAEPRSSTSRTSLRASVRSIPPPPPPPQHAAPLPPKLAMEAARQRQPDAGPSSQHTELAYALEEEQLAGGIGSLALGPGPPLPPPPNAAQTVAPGPGSGMVHVDAGGVPVRAFAHGGTHREVAGDGESVYELPPPAYDAIDFSVRVPTPARGRTRGSHG
ncbi:hypothetical protein AcW1_008755 [Taiwanofungus camphoratus]|nr:hypothetical protein AcW1_008755 [Antrodia cinnamomea]